MRITSKGQVTIPQEVRNRLGLLPHTEVEFEVAGDHARIRKARRTEGCGVRGQKSLRALRGSADTRMSTDEIIALTKGKKVLITRRGQPAAVMGPPPKEEEQNVSQVVKEMLAFRDEEGPTLGRKARIRQLMEEGRRF